MEVINLHIYPSVFKFESRILKETSSILKLRLATKIIIISSGERSQPSNEEISPNIKVVRIKSLLPTVPIPLVNKILFYLEFYLRAFFYGLRSGANIINCHSLMMLPVAVLLKRMRNCKLIYDPHELETERIGLSGLFQMFSKWTEKRLIRRADAVIVVSDSIHDWYRRTYGLDTVYTIKNIPQRTHPISSNILKEKFKIPLDHQLFIYQGLISEGRSIELYLQVFSKLTTNKHLVVIGFGPMEPLVRGFASRFSNIHFHPPLSPSDILRYTCSADIGLSVIENSCLSYYYSLPNKFFEYIVAGIPLIASDFPDMSAPIEQHNIGWTVKVSEDCLYEKIQNLSSTDLEEKKNRIRKVRSLFAWENQESTLVEVFGGLDKPN